MDHIPNSLQFGSHENADHGSADHGTRITISIQNHMPLFRGGRSHELLMR